MRGEGGENTIKGPLQYVYNKLYMCRGHEGINNTCTIQWLATYLSIIKQITIKCMLSKIIINSTRDITRHVSFKVKAYKSVVLTPTLGLTDQCSAGRDVQ